MSRGPTTAAIDKAVAAEGIDGIHSCAQIGHAIFRRHPITGAVQRGNSVTLVVGLDWRVFQIEAIEHPAYDGLASPMPRHLAALVEQLEAQR
jgi:hypothetical protein